MTEDTENKNETPTPQEEAPDLAALQAENEELRKQNEDYLDSLQRERASFANYKRRVDLDNASFADRLLGDHVKFFLPVVDDLERALLHRPEDPDCDSWISGIDLILQKLLKALEAKDVHPLDLKPGDLFDPNTQEAVTHEENDNYTDGQIIEVVQTGYQIKDRVIRPALVRVAK
ncbi:MAG: nucleotide exchange factor GrpE [Anaerolineaceae bacterium]|nr:nucleotide exchange factor GrpE [Anaerolineaceae bacterium]MDI9530548.1 nucleotide exchange factor GrpE [Chloroflexota bacterium]HNZ16019.1 nucleotide exchange factor GrpE [Anaerolineaceae bacterium]HOF27890.1 nucleotide exchange factor GrpE [Anaerolineaceae bacterium]